MIIVKLMGGMGNQMFQYAFGKALATKYNTVLKLDTSFLLDRKPRNNFTFRDYDLDLFNIEAEFATQEEIEIFTKRLKWIIPNKIINRVMGVKESYVIEPHFHFSERCFNAKDNSYLEGYWQTEKYFYPIKNEIKNKYFSLKESCSSQAQLLLAEIQSNNAIAVNVRRGDFVNNPFHGTCSPGYYKKGEEIILSKIDNPYFFVFSDEIEWAQENLHFSGPVKFVGEEYNGRKFQDKIRLMSACKHFIISNSSFAWWAAWLNTNPDKIVIAPKAWFHNSKWDTKDILPPNWIAI